MYKLVKNLQKIFLKLPLIVLYYFGVICGLLMYYFDRKKRVIAFKNIKMAFPEKSNKKLQVILRKSFINFSLSIIESFVAKKVFKFVEIYGIQNLKEAGILIGVHEGSWELYNWLLAHKIKYVMFANRQPNKNLDRFLNECREAEGINVCFSSKELIKYLKNNYFIAMAFDHGAERNAPLAIFFSQLIPTPRGAVYLAKKFNKKIYAGFGWRKTRFSHVLEIAQPINADCKIEETLAKLNSIFEKYLEKHPQEYLWFYKRFKRKKNRQILIINDGRIGHLKQSLAFVSILEESTDYKLTTQTIDIRYKNKYMRILADICAFFSSKFCIGCGRCLRFFLTEEVYNQITKLYADIVVSTGSLVAPINRIFSFSIGARSVSIFRPNIPLSKFDMTIIPQHDRISSANTVKIKGALFYPLNLEEKVKKCKIFFNLSNDKKIAVFLGGPIYDKDEFVENIKLFLQDIKKFSLEKNYKLLISTSRRTPKTVEDYTKKNLAKFLNTEVIVFANEQNYDFVFEGFVYFSDIVFVTAESISMISEIISFSKPCVCVFLEKLDSKHKIFLKSIENEVDFLDKPYNIGKINIKKSFLYEENKKNIKEAIGKIL
ncbi:MAG: mitochondrial fission ELM1 family protein [Candidatus Omnitrophica bacterium]|nr:mitochondrial fission ELM1 family protein [Candidatus Omnitrophota bacterium]